MSLLSYWLLCWFCPATASFLRNNTVLTELRLVCCGIDAMRASQLAETLSGIKMLDMSLNIVNLQCARHLGKLSAWWVWGYGLTCNIRQCQCATFNREMSVVKYYCHHSLIPNHKCHIPLFANFSHGEHWCASRCWCSSTRHTTFVCVTSIANHVLSFEDLCCVAHRQAWSVCCVLHSW